MGYQKNSNGAQFNEALKLRIPVLEDLPRVELRQLRYFLAVAEELNFTRAAERMGIAQPPLSQQILSLEHQLRAKLFIRSRRQVKLTPEGEALQIYARRIINATMLAAESVHAITNGLTGQLAIGAVCSAIHSLIPHLLPTFISKHPGVKLHLQEMTVLEQQRALREERIDIAILREPMASSEFKTRKLFEEPFMVAVPKTNPLARLNSVSLDQVAREPLVQVYRSTNEEYSDLMFEGLRQNGYDLNIAHEASDMQSLLGLVGAGFGVSMVPASLQNIQISTVKYIRLSDDVPRSTLSLAWNDEAVTPMMKQFLAVTETLLEGFDMDDCFLHPYHDAVQPIPFDKAV